MNDRDIIYQLASIVAVQRAAIVDLQGRLVQTRDEASKALQAAQAEVERLRSGDRASEAAPAS